MMDRKLDLPSGFRCVTKPLHSVLDDGQTRDKLVCEFQLKTDQVEFSRNRISTGVLRFAFFKC